MTKINECILVVVHGLENEITKIANAAEMVEFDMVCVSSLLGIVENHFLAHPRREDKRVIG